MLTIDDPRSMQLDPQILHFLRTLEARGEPPFYTLSPAEARNAFLDIQRPVGARNVDCEDHIIRGGPTGQVSLHIVRPKGASGNLPGIMYFHGGGRSGDRNPLSGGDPPTRPPRPQLKN